MPYVDHGQPQASKGLPPVVPWLAVIAAAAMGPVLWYGCHLWFGYSYAGALFSGLGVGLAAKFTLSRPMPPLRVAVIVLVVLSSLVGYAWVDWLLWTPFMLNMTIERFFRDFLALLMVAAGGYIAFVLAFPRLR